MSRFATQTDALQFALDEVTRDDAQAHLFAEPSDESRARFGERLLTCDVAGQRTGVIVWHQHVVGVGSGGAAKCLACGERSEDGAAS